MRVPFLPFATFLFASLVSGCTTTSLVTGDGPAAALSGGILASGLGEGLSNAARNRAIQAEYTALETGLAGAPIKWSTEKNVQGEVTPDQPYVISGKTCRRYVHQISVDGSVRSGTGTACREANGRWLPLE